jgi:O-antigen/teichoic acid export membrane protein
MAKLMSVLFVAYAARVLGPRDFGNYTLIITFTMIFSYFTDFGITPMAVREIAREKGKAEFIFNHVLSIRMCFVIVSFFLIFVIVSLLNYSHEVKSLIYLMCISLLFSTFSSSFRILYIAFEKMAVPSVVSVLTSFLSAFSGILMLYLGFGLMGVILIKLGEDAIGAVIAGIWIRKRFFKYKFSYDFPFWIDVMRQSMPFGVIAFFTQANRFLTILLLSKLPGPVAGEIAVGYYNSASSTAQSVMMIPMSFSQAVLPTISSNRNNPEIIKGIIDKATKYILVFVSLPLVLATAFFPHEIIRFLFGKAYLPSVPALTILGWTYGFMAFNAAVQMTLSSSREINRFIPWATLTLVINIVLAVPLILYYGFVGAAVAGLVSTIIGTLIRYRLLKSIWGIGINDLKESNAVFIPSLLILITVWIISSMQINKILLLVLIAAVYLGFLYFFRVLRYKELKSLGEAFRVKIPFVQKSGKRD